MIAIVRDCMMLKHFPSDICGILRLGYRISLALKDKKVPTYSENMNFNFQISAEYCAVLNSQYSAEIEIIVN